MTLSDRDRKIGLFLAPVVVLAAYWFLLFAPKREEAKTLGAQLTQVESERDAAVAQAEQAEASKVGFKQDYATMVRLGKAIPSTVDMPSLLVQLDRAAAGTDIRFQRISAGERQTATVAPGSGSTPGGSTPDGAAAAGGAPAGTSAGQAAEKAGEAQQTSDDANAAAGADAASSAAGAASAPAAGALDSVPLEFTFNGSFFRLADFFHELKRFVRLSGEGVDVRGRLMAINSLTLTPTDFPKMEAQVTATVYLSPKSQGATAGASPEGPAPATQGASPAPAPSSSSTTPPTATAAR